MSFRNATSGAVTEGTKKRKRLKQADNVRSQQTPRETNDKTFKLGGKS